jgi:hypothetical protein
MPSMNESAAAPSAERRRRLAVGEEVVARRAEQRDGRVELGPDRVRRVDPDAARARQRQAVAVADPDLEIRGRLQGIVDPAEEVEVAHRSP